MEEVCIGRAGTPRVTPPRSARRASAKFLEHLALERRPRSGKSVAQAANLPRLRAQARRTVNPTLLLAIATLALVVGPLLERVARRAGWIAAAIDGATVGGIVVFSLLHLMPEAGAHLGWWALLWLALGLMLPVWAERLLEQASQTWRLTIGFLVLVLFLLHEVIESAALATKAYDERVSMVTLIVVVGHRLPLGLLLWGQTRQRFGRPVSIAVLALVASFTWFGPMIVPAESGAFSATLSALLAGGLLHLVLQHAPKRTTGEVRSIHGWSALGFIVAVALFVPYLTGGAAEHVHGEVHAHGAGELAHRVLDLVYETALPLLVGVLGAALIEAFLPGSMTRWLSRGSKLRQAVSGVVIGAPMPVCSCGVLPVYRSLIQKGVPATAALALLIAAPEIDLASLLLSWPMLGPATTIARLLCALILALAVGLIVGRMVRGASVCALHEGEGARPGSWASMRRALFETWGHLAPWILVGLVATALVEPWISTDWAAATPAWVQVIVLSLAGMPTYICATAATPFAALLLAKGFTPGAVIAFLLTGPATNVTTFGALRRMHSTRVAIAFVVTAFAVTCLLGWSVDSVVRDVAIKSPTELHEHGGPLAHCATAILLALTLWVLFLEGPRAFFAQLWITDEPHAHDHDHEHDHGGQAAEVR